MDGNCMEPPLAHAVPIEQKDPPESTAIAAATTTTTAVTGSNNNDRIGDGRIVNTDLVASNVSDSPEPVGDSNNNNGIITVIPSSSTADDPSSTIDALNVTPATDAVADSPPQFAYGLSDAHYEDYWSKKYRRRKRRRTRMMVGGMTGFVVGTFVLGPVGGLVGATTGAVISRTASKVGEKKKDRRLARERQEQEDLREDQERRDARDRADSTEGYQQRIGSPNRRSGEREQALPLLEISAASTQEMNGQAGVDGVDTGTGHGSPSTIAAPSSPTHTILSARSSSNRGGVVASPSSPLMPEDMPDNDFEYDEYDDLRLPPPQDTTLGYESPRERRRRERRSGSERQLLFRWRNRRNDRS